MSASTDLTPATEPEPELKVRLSASISEDSDQRLRLAAAIVRMQPGPYLDAFLRDHLPPVEIQAASIRNGARRP
jgi:hypothetical protein